MAVKYMCWVEVDGIQSEVHLPVELIKQPIGDAHRFNLTSVAGLLASFLEAKLTEISEAQQPATGPMITAVLFGKGQERLAVYFINRQAQSVIDSMSSTGWQVLGRHDAEQPFAGCKRIVVYSGDEIMKASES